MSASSSVPTTTSNTSRRSSPPPPNNSLERKFELLEARFTQPLGKMGGLSSPNQHPTSGFGYENNSNLSEHSFGFSASSRSNHSQQHQPTMTVRSKRNSRSMTNLDIVNRAAAEHIRKVASGSPVPMNTNPTTASTNSFSYASSSSSSHNSNSQQTVVMGNRTNLQQQQQKQNQKQPEEPQRVVAESPPVLISPAKASTATKPKVARALQIVTGNDKGPQPQSSEAPIKAGSTKRKSVPKRKIASIQDRLGGQSPVKSITPTASSSVESRSPRPNHFLLEQSRDRSNNSNHVGGNNNKRPKVLLPPANNKSIHDFFSSSKKKPTTTATVSAGKNGHAAWNGTGAVPQTNNSITPKTTQTTPATMDSTAKATKTSSTTTSAPPSSETTTAAAALAAQTAATEQWQAKCAKLQQKLQDKDEQLKAVTGNKTILHTALQQALTKARNELALLQTSSQEQIQNISRVLEESLRWKFERQAKELRETLSADGTRLGKIVSTRAGMRVIDTWEEGYASKDWQVRRDRWKQKHKQLVEKQEQLQKRLKDTTTTTTTTTSSEQPMTKLEIEEAQESIQMHLESLLREEKELLGEEQALNDEKGAHIRALKRVASEDASRFRNRAKLHDRYVLDRLLGKGGFSEVWKGYDLKELREVAVKIHQLDPRWPDSKKENYTKHVSREYEIHRNVRHCRIVSLYDVFEIDNNSFATVLECCKGTDLDTLLKRKKRLPERQARAILLQILSGMKYLSQPGADGSRQGIIHYDLKPGNILFDEFGDAKITDFGLSKIVDAPDPAESMELTSQGAGTYWYLPPECFVTGEQVRISNKVDVWSIGVIFYQMLYGQRPFGEGKSQDKLLADHTMLNAQEVHLPEKPAITESGKEFVKQCLMYDQAFRPTIAQLCENPYVLQKGI